MNDLDYISEMEQIAVHNLRNLSVQLRQRDIELQNIALSCQLHQICKKCIRLDNRNGIYFSIQNMKIIQELNKNADHKHLMLKYGMGQFIVQHIKMKNIKSDYFFKNIIVLTKMQEKHTFPPPLCTTIFEIAIRKLEAEINNDGHIIKIIFLLRKIKKNVSVTK